MGVTIHYQGQLNHLEDLSKLVEELSDIARSMNWKFTQINRDDDNLEFEGIVLRPTEKCESISFLFDREGHLRNIADLVTEQFEADPRLSYYICVKTQFAKIETHLWIVGLFRYLKKKYISNLEVTDEGEYWETGNIETLRAKREFLDRKINQLAGALSKVTEVPDDIDGLVKKIEETFREMEKDG